MKVTLVLLSVLFLSACSNKVMVRKDSCKDIFDGAVWECEKVSK